MNYFINLEIAKLKVYTQDKINVARITENIFNLYSLWKHVFAPKPLLTNVNTDCIQITT